MGDIVDAIKSGAFQLKKTTGPLAGEEKLAARQQDSSSDFAKMAAALVLERRKREQDKAQRAEVEKAKSQTQRQGELDNLLTEFGEGI